MYRFAIVTVLAACSSGAPDDDAWMASLDDTRSLSELAIPGTHESAALYEPVPGSAKCQEMSLEQQLVAGARYFDIRCRRVNDGFAIYHGPIDQLQTFDDVLATTYAFLDEHPQQTVMMSIKEESEPVDSTRGFEEIFRSYAERDPDRWYLADAVPTLGEARGKIVLVRRFGATATPLGIDAAPWGDDTTFTIANAAMVRVQDAYRVTDPEAKWAAITALLDEAAAGAPATLFLNYTSGYESRSGLPNNVVVADAINPKLDVLLRERAAARTGVLAMDHVDAGRIKAVVRMNGLP